MIFKKKLDFYFWQPFLIALYPVSNLFSFNGTEAYFVDYFIIAFTVFLICAASFFILNKILKSRVKSSIFLSFLIGVFYLIPVLRDILPSNLISQLAKISLFGIRLVRVSYLFVFFLPFFIFFIYKFFTLNKKVLNFFAVFLFLPFLALNIFALAKIIIIKGNVRTVIREYEKENIKFLEKNKKFFIDAKNDKKLPDIYFIILDAYASNNAWKNFYNHDNSKFIKSLQDRGFCVGDEAFSNYGKTQYSLAATLNLNYHDKFNDGLFVHEILNNNVLKFLDLSGYKYFHIKSSSQFNCQIPFYKGPLLEWIKDRFFLPYGFISSFIRIRTSLSNFWDYFVKKKLHKDILKQFDDLKSVVFNPEPKFIFAHILCPHPPVVFDEEGDFHTDGDYEYGVARQSLFINKKVLEVVDFIFKNSKNPPVIILQGDHGFFWSGDRNDAFGILSAFYLPGQDKSKFLENITPVNNFRLIFNSYFGTNFEILENKQVG